MSTIRQARHRSARSTVVAAGLGATLFLACVGSGGTSATAATKTTKAKAKATSTKASPSVAPSTSAAPSAGAGSKNDPTASFTFTYAVPNGTLDPAKTASPFDLAYMRPVYDTLIVRGADNTFQPGLALKWTFSGSTLTLTLRKGVVFHDGNPFNGSAVKANLDRSMTIDGGTQKSLLSSVSSVDVVADDAVRLNLKNGAGALLGALTAFPGLMISPAAFNTDLAQNAVGTGAYKVSRYEKNVVVEYVPFDKAWNKDEAQVAKLRIINQADSGQRLNQIKTNQAQAANMDTNLVADAKSAGMQVQAKEANNIWVVNFNLNGALGDPNARKAVNLAIDRDALLKGLDFGYGAVGSQIQPAGEAGANPTVKVVFDPSFAKKLAESSGLSKQKLVFMGSAIPTIAAYQEAIAAMLNDAGIPVQIRAVERAQVTTELQKGNWDMYMNFYPGAADPWIAYDTMLRPGSLYFPGDAGPTTNALLAKVADETDVAARTQLLRNLAAEVDRGQLIAVLAHPRRPVVAAANVTGFRGNVFAVPDVRGTGIAAK